MDGLERGIASIDERTDFVNPDVLGMEEVPIQLVGNVPDTEPLPFSVDHEEGRFFLLTNSGATRCLPVGAEGEPFVRWEVPNGRTALSLCRKRAVAWCGELMRLWPGDPCVSPRILLLDDRGWPLIVEPGNPFWHSVDVTIALSKMALRPAMLIDIVRSEDWW